MAAEGKEKLRREEVESPARIRYHSFVFYEGLDGVPRVGRMDEAVAYKGIIKGRMIELEAFPPFRDGQPVRVSIEPFGGDGPTSSPVEVRRVMHESPHLCAEAVQELERAIGAGRLPMSDGSIFTRE